MIEVTPRRTKSNTDLVGFSFPEETPDQDRQRVRIKESIMQNQELKQKMAEIQQITIQPVGDAQKKKIQSEPIAEESGKV